MKTNLRIIDWLLAGVFAITFATGVIAAPLTWFPGPSLGTPLSGSATVFYNGRNYLTGGDDDLGYGSPFSSPLSLAATNTYWSYLTPYNSLNIAGGAIVSDGNLVIYGGTDGTNSQNITVNYSLSGDTTPALPNMNVPRSYLGYAPDRSGNAYAFGGLDDSGNPLSSAERLNPVSDTTPAWSYIASLPGPRYNFPAVFNRTNYIYLFGGLTDPATAIETDSVLRYSVSGNSFSNMAPMPVAVAGSAATLGQDGNIYVIGGTSGGIPTALVQVYNPISNSWALSTPLPEPLTLAAIGVDSVNRLIVMGGVDTNGYDLADVWRSQPFGVPDSPPVITNFPATSVPWLGNYSSSLVATGNPPPVYSLVSGPAGMQVGYFTGAITWSPQTLDQIGTNPVTVQASNYAGTTNYSFNIVVPNPPPAVPSNFTEVAVSDTSATITWSPPSPAAGPVTYSVAIPHPYHSSKGSGGGVNYQVILTGIPTNSLTFSLAPGSSASYALSATGPGGSTGFSYSTWFGVYTTAPQGPANIALTGLTSTSVSLAWTPSPGPAQSALYSPVTSYAIMEWKVATQTGVPTVTNLSGTNGMVTGLVPGQSHFWYISGVDAQGTYSKFNGFTYVAVSNPIPQPAVLASVTNTPGNPGGLQFTIQPSASQTTFIQATTNLSNPTAWITIATNPPSGTSFNFTDPNSALFPSRYYRVISP